jgi:hypothetical protein
MAYGWRGSNAGIRALLRDVFSLGYREIQRILIFDFFQLPRVYGALRTVTRNHCYPAFMICRINASFAAGACFTCIEFVICVAILKKLIYSYRCILARSCCERIHGRTHIKFDSSKAT